MASLGCSASPRPRISPEPLLPVAPLLPSSEQLDASTEGGREGEREGSRFSTPKDVRNAEHLQRLLAGLEGLKEESGDNLSRLKAWIQEQHQELHAWLKKHQPIHARRLEAIGAVQQMLLGEEGDLLLAVEGLLLLDESALLSLLPSLCDAIVLDTGHITAEQRASLRGFLLAYARASQHAALRVCWYMRAMGTLSREGEGERGWARSPKTVRRADSASQLRRVGSHEGQRLPASVDMSTTRALSLLLQIEEQLSSSPLHASAHQDLEAGCPGQESLELARMRGTGRGSCRPTESLSQRLPPPGDSAVRNRLSHLRHSLQVVKRLTDACASLMDVPREQRVEACKQELGKLSGEVAGVWLPVAPSPLRNHALQALLPSEALPLSTNKRCPVVLHLPVLIPEREGARGKQGGVVGELAAWAAETAAAWSDRVSFSQARRAAHSELESSAEASLCQNEHASAPPPTIRAEEERDSGGAMQRKPIAPVRESFSRQLYDAVQSTQQIEGDQSSKLAEGHACPTAENAPHILPPDISLNSGRSDVSRNLGRSEILASKPGVPSVSPHTSRPVLPLMEESCAAQGVGEGREGRGEREGEEGSFSVQSMFGEPWVEKEARISRLQSELSGRPPPGYTYRVLPCLVKTGESLLQEQFAVHLAHLFQDIFDTARLPLRLHPYSVVATSPSAGLIQLLTNALSIDSLKRSHPLSTLPHLFTTLYGPTHSRQHRRAISNFCSSTAAWAVVSYLLQLKDRHNGNILLHADGHVVHIDFGFMLTNSPGGNLNFESAPFKLTSEYVQLMGGARSQTFLRFRELVIKGFQVARRHADKIIAAAQLALDGAGRDMPCFIGGEKAVEALRSRFELELNRRQFARHVDDMVTRSLDHWSTTCYDKYQRCMLGIM